MADDRIWFRQDTAELSQEWFIEELPAGARLAWLYLKAYVKVERPSQKRHSRAPALSARTAARTWNLSVEDVESMLTAVTTVVDSRTGKPRLTIDGEDWVLSDVSVCAHEDTARRNADKQPQTTANEAEEPGVQPSSGICAANGSKSEQTGAPCHATVTDTETVTEDQPAVDDLAREPEAVIPVSESVALTWQDGSEYWAIANEPMRWVGLCLCRVNAAAGAGPPTIKLVERHVGANQPCRQLVDAIGWERAADLFNWCAKHLEGARSWTTVWGNYAGYLQQMDNGVSRVPKNQAAIVRAEPTETRSAEIKKQLWKRRLDEGKISRAEYEMALKELSHAA